MTSDHKDKSATNKPFEDGLLQLSGSDALQFLQGQTTAKFDNVQPFDVRQGAFCNPKGRVLADVLSVVIAEDAILMRSRIPVLRALQKHLTPYLAFSKSKLTLLDWLIEVWQDVKTASSNYLSKAELHFNEKNLVEVHVDRGEGFTEIWRNRKTADLLYSQHRVDSKLLDIEQGQARIEQETIGTFLPQDLNYDLSGTVNFQKGCYTGQEIIARLHFRGTPKRRLFRAQLIDRDKLPTPGTALCTASGNTVGSIVNLANSVDRHEMLVTIRPDAVDQTLLCKEDEQLVKVVKPCYSGRDQSTSDL